MRKNTVKVSTGEDLVWPQVCVLCLKPATQDHIDVMGALNDRIPYCDDCFGKVRRLEDWIGGAIIIAAVIGLIGALMGLIGIVVQKGWAELLHIGQSSIVAFGGALIFGVGSYVLLRILFLPIHLVFHSKLARPGVKARKVKERGSVTPLRFTNVEYAELFREANDLA